MNKPRALLLLILTLLLLWVTEAKSTDASPTYTIYLVRHAEKATGPDPELTRAGAERAGRIGGWLQGRNISAVWSSDYRRTRQSKNQIVG